VRPPPRATADYAQPHFGGYANAAVPRPADSASVQDLSGQTMGTGWSLRFDNPAMLPHEAARQALVAAFDAVIGQMSTWHADSDICQFRQAAPGTRFALAPEFARVLACALHWAGLSDGAIDPTVGPLVSLWGFGAHAQCQPSRPDAGALARARERTGWQRLAFDASTATVLQPGGMALDLSGIAKGFAVDHAAIALRNLGLSDFLLEIGGELRASGRRPGGQPWQVQIETAPGVGLRLPLADRSIATSGDRWHAHRDAQGLRWSHTIDPRNGLPVDGRLASVSVVHDECMQADALATVMTVLGPDDGLAFAQRHALAAVFCLRTDEGVQWVASDAWPNEAAASTGGRLSHRATP